jgi:DNA-binding protein HU-beta
LTKLYTIDLVRETAKKHRYAQRIVAGVLSSALKEVQRALAHGDRVQLTGFGTFYPAQRGASRARNFQTGEWIEVPEMKVARFSAGKSLTKAVRRKRG